MKKTLIKMMLLVTIGSSLLVGCVSKLEKAEDKTSSNTITTTSNEEKKDSKANDSKGVSMNENKITTIDTSKKDSKVENKKTTMEKVETTKTQVTTKPMEDRNTTKVNEGQVANKREEKLQSNEFYMGIDNTRKDWSHGYPADLSNTHGIYSVGNGNIALTFDLGTEVGYTKKILEVLKEKGVKGTFFVTGTYAEKNKEIMDQIIKDGHKIGIHGYDHTNMIKLTENGIDPLIEDIEKWKKVTGLESNLYRAPEGAYSDRGMQVLSDLGYTSVNWGFAHRDWEENNQPEPQIALSNIKKGIQDGDVVLLHAYETNSIILGDLIDYLKENNYNIVNPE